jgi:uncharacterized membrane protein HdeD (DUF308 family)
MQPHPSFLSETNDTVGSPGPILRAVAKNWWVLLIRGIAAIAFGVLAFVLPGITLLTLVALYAIYALVDGVLSLVAAFQNRPGSGPTWWLVISGVLGIAAGLLTLLWPGVTALLLILFIGAWSLVRGVFEIVGAIQLRKEIDNEWMLILSGAISVLFGAAVMILPGAGALALVWLIGIYAVLFGILMIALSLRLKKMSV